MSLDDWSYALGFLQTQPPTLMQRTIQELFANLPERGVT